VRINGNAEGGSSPQDYFRTSLHDYVTARLRGTYDFSSSLRFAADFGILKNSDPEAGVNLDLASKTATGTLSWTPKNSKLFSALADYSYSSVRSSILYLVPQTLTEAPSIYTESGHTGTLLASIKWFSAGGSFFHSTGSRPVVYYQPLIRVSVPVTPHITLKGEYRYYGFNERSYSFENFSSNQVLGSIRFSL
jgi:hypothetical protein